MTAARRSLRELGDGLDVQPCDAIGFVAGAIEAMLAMRAGELDRAEALAGDCLRLGLEVGDADAEGWYGAQLLAIRWLQGRSAELLPVVRDLDHATTVVESNESFAAATASVAAAAGETDLARATLAGIRKRGLAATRESSCWLVTLAAVADAAYAVGDAVTAAELYPLLAPYAHLPVMASLAVACLGSAHRPLGLAAATVGDLTAAVAHLEAAVVADLELANLPCHAISTAALAEALEQRDEPATQRAPPGCGLRRSTRPTSSASPASSAMARPAWRCRARSCAAATAAAGSSARPAGWRRCRTAWAWATSPS